MWKYVEQFVSSLLNCHTGSEQTRSRTTQSGSGENSSVVVSNVLRKSPSDTCLPRLNEGDEILSINNNEVRAVKPEQIEKLIQAAANTRGKKLCWRVRQRVYDREERKDTLISQVSQKKYVSLPLLRRDTLSESIAVIRERLEDESLILKFESIHRKQSGETTNIAKLSENVQKNRYRDISPYDTTRVVLEDCITGDYINASHINMMIPTSNIVNRYIATQGPLPTTCIEFWQMVWEQKSKLVVMVTTLLERGRTKCHKYWPDKHKTETFGHLEVTCIVEMETPYLVHREFCLKNKQTNTETNVIQMQYVAWPDHGVPIDASDFLSFVWKVREYRDEVNAPTIVHCSAGIGRTGVLILMETAMCLIEANEPVYPIQIVLEMRRQRAMLIQTTSQFKFVCEAIVRVFNDGTVKPLEKFNALGKVLASREDDI
ncbi:tyrosine-protein phosphatase non-receptor type 3-like isoform X2 [Limulus polyphemus]|uniref:Tyrosine-protein phosphatase non-receptor type 3-like isoform X2 n=1 Tax=Limulus polyphemus TaxID=6850 RepID=A0ABM1B3L6_LIMPO|nr:tyrosine-protein phosphatase non-receptor type 3-like isoform X2 [Limulus polyphemus]